jgi:hypothetical protein
VARLPSLGNSDFDLQMSNPYSTSPVVGRMPRADDCHRCSHPMSEHAGTKCLFDSCEASPITREEFIRRFHAWASGQKIEDALANIVYALTGGA